MTYTCTRCGDLYDEEIPALEHDYAKTETPPTCTEAGRVTYVCSLCGDTYTEAGKAAPGHDYQETARKEATIDAAGSVTYTCTRCGDSYAEELPRMEKPTVPSEQTETVEPSEEPAKKPARVPEESSTTEPAEELTGEPAASAASEEASAGRKTVSAEADGSHTYGDPVWTWADDYRSATAVFTCIDPDCGHTETLTDESPVYEGVSAAASVTLNGEDYSSTVTRPRVRLQVKGVDAAYSGNYGVSIQTGTVTVDVNGTPMDYEGTQSDYSYITLRAGDLVTVHCLPNEENDAYLKYYNVTAHYPEGSRDYTTDTEFYAIYPAGNTGLIVNDVDVTFDIHTHEVTLDTGSSYYYGVRYIDPTRTGSIIKLEVKPSNSNNYALTGVYYTYEQNGETVTVQAEKDPYQADYYRITMPPPTSRSRLRPKRSTM